MAIFEKRYKNVDSAIHVVFTFIDWLFMTNKYKIICHIQFVYMLYNVTILTIAGMPF